MIDNFSAGLLGPSEQGAIRGNANAGPDSGTSDENRAAESDKQSADQQRCLALEAEIAELKKALAAAQVFARHTGIPALQTHTTPCAMFCCAATDGRAQATVLAPREVAERCGYRDHAAETRTACGHGSEGPPKPIPEAAGVSKLSPCPFPPTPAVLFSLVELKWLFLKPNDCCFGSFFLSIENLCRT